MLIGPMLFPLYLGRCNWAVSIVLVAAFAIDSVTQVCGLRTSKNWLRLVTGIGFSVAVLGLLFEAATWLSNITP